MKIGTLVANDRLGHGIVIKEYGKSVVMVMWYEGGNHSSTIITMSRKSVAKDQNWYAPSDLGRVFIISK